MNAGILLGLSAAICWGLADFIARYSSKRIGAYRTLFYMQVAGLAFASAWSMAADQGGGMGALARGAREHWRLAAFLGASSGLSMLAFYSALEHGTLSIVAPIASSYPALTVLLAYASGERLTAMRAAGVALTLGGVVLASIPENSFAGNTGAETRVLAPGVLLAMVCALGFGVTYWALGFYAIAAWGALGTVWTQRLSTVAWLGATVVPLRRSIAPPAGNGWWLVIVVGVLDAFGFVLSNRGFEREQVGVVTVLGSLFGAVTLLLAFVVLRERLSRRQWAGVALIFAGIVLINAR
ncbi:MAG TPA: DMT family transporter [Patescibacteria group bacterium]|nr:DMT family transporter [Patescibacteria group bacterium]